MKCILCGESLWENEQVCRNCGATTPLNQWQPGGQAPQASPYGQPGGQAPQASPYGQPGGQAPQASPYGQPGGQAPQASPYGQPGGQAPYGSPYGTQPGGQIPYAPYGAWPGGQVPYATGQGQPQYSYPYPPGGPSAYGDGTRYGYPHYTMPFGPPPPGKSDTGKAVEPAIYMEKGNAIELVMREYRPEDIPALLEIWNDIVEDGVSFPGDELLSLEEMRGMLAQQTRTICACAGDSVAGLYILHPNNIGRCAHVANASYGVSKAFRGNGIGERLVVQSLETARECGFHGLQFNAVVAGNRVALSIYRKHGFAEIGIIPGGFRLKSGEYSDMYILYKAL